MTGLTWVSYAEGSPTVAANGVATTIGKLIAAGEQRELANFGQGREQISVHADIQDKIIRDFFAATEAGKLFDAGYNIRANMGGTQTQRDIARAWLKRFIGIDDETFVLNHIGRVALNETFKAFGKNSALIAPFERWPMIDDIAKDYDLHVDRSYQLRRGNLGAAIEAASESSIYKRENQIWYIGAPSNPRGLMTTQKDMNNLLDILACGVMEGGATNKPVLLFDVPYFHAAEQKDAPGQPILDMGFTPDFFARLRELGVTCITSVSFSKALGMATPGFSFMTVSENMADKMRGQLVRSATGGSYHPAYYDAVMQFFTPEHDADIRAHFKTLRDNYVANCRVLEQQLGGVAPVLKNAFGNVADYGLLLDGDPAMTRLMELPKDGIFGRVVPVPSSFNMRELTIARTNDLLSYIANVHGVVLVDNGLNEAKDTILVRIATAEPSDRFAAGCERLARGLAIVAQSPRAPV